MHDALPGIVEPEQLDAVLRGILLDLPHHARELGIGDVAARAARRHVMVGDAEGEARLGDRHAPLGQLAEGVERALVHVVAVDPEQRLAVLAADDLVGGPQLVDQGLRLVHARKSRRTVPNEWTNIEGACGPMLGCCPASREERMSRRSFSRQPPPVSAIHRARRRGRGRRAACAGRAARARRRRQGRRAASGLRRAVLFRPAGPHRRAAGDRGDQRGRRHQVARRRQDRSGARRRAVDAGGRQRRGREDERRRRRRHRRRLRQRHLPRREPDRRALRPALYRRRRRGRQHRHPRPEEHLPLRPGLRRHRQDRDRQPRHHQRAGRQGREDRDDRARGLGVRRRPRQAPEHATARARLPGAGNHPASDADPRLQQRRAQDQGAEPRPRDSGELLQRIRAARAHHAAAEACGRRASTRCSAAPPRPTSSSRNSPRPRNTSWTAITGSIRRTRRRWR